MKNTEFYRTNASTRQPGQAGVCSSEQRKSQRKVEKKKYAIESQRKGKQRKVWVSSFRSLRLRSLTHSSQASTLNSRVSIGSSNLEP